MSVTAPALRPRHLLSRPWRWLVDPFPHRQVEPYDPDALSGRQVTRWTRPRMLALSRGLSPLRTVLALAMLPSTYWALITGHVVVTVAVLVAWLYAGPLLFSWYPQHPERRGLDPDEVPPRLSGRSALRSLFTRVSLSVGVGVVLAVFVPWLGVLIGIICALVGAATMALGLLS